MLSQGKLLEFILKVMSSPALSPFPHTLYFSDANNGYIIPIPIFGIPSGNRIPYHFSAGQGNEVTSDRHFRSTTSGTYRLTYIFQLNLKDNEEIEFELNCYGPDNFEVTKIEKLRPGSLMFEFKTDLDNQDRDQGIILRMPESGPSGQPGKIEYRNNADACQYLDFEMEDIIPLKTISIRVSFFFKSGTSGRLVCGLYPKGN